MSETVEKFIWFENRAKNNLSQVEWDKIKKDINKYLI